MVATTDFTLPPVSAAIATARVSYNNALYAVLAAFNSSNSKPTSSNITVEDVATAPPEGMLWWNTLTKKLYINNPRATSSPYTPFSRLGIALSFEANVAQITANIGQYEMGELVAVINNTAGSSNNRVYLISDSNKTLVDLGLPFANSVTAAIIADGSVTTAKIADYSITTDKLANLSVNTAKLASGSVTTAKIADGAVKDAQLDSGLVFLGLFV